MIENNRIYKILHSDLSDPKTRIVRAAIGEFALRSMEGARTREITAKSGANLAAISYHFGGKEELYHFVIKELCEYFDYSAEPYYQEGKKILECGGASEARAFISKFLFGFIRRFSSVKEVSHVMLLLSREQVAPTKSYKYLYKSVVQTPTEFISKLIAAASKGRYSEQINLTFAQTLWINIRSYCAGSDAVMRLHNWKNIGDPEIDILEMSLNIVLDKTVR